MTPRLDTATIASFAAPTGWTEITRGIFAARYLHTLVGIRQLNALLAEKMPVPLAESGFPASLEALTSAPTEAQKLVLSHPSAAFWVDVAWNLVSRQAHEHFPEMHLVPHLTEFARFAFSALLLSGVGQLTAVVRADSAGRISLPGSGVALAAGAPWARTPISINDGLLNGIFEQHRVPRLASGLELNWLDHDLRLGGRTDFDFAELSEVEAQHWLDELNQHLNLVTRVSAPLAEELTGGLRVIVPVNSPSKSLHVSGSFLEAPGMVALSLGERMATVEALVHEYGHQKLNAILPLDPLIIDDSGEAIHYSPWRDDPRPLRGLLHAVYSFEMVLNFYNALLGLPDAAGFAPQQIVNRAYRIVRQVHDGLTGLNDQAAFSPIGRAFVDALSGRVAECADELPAPTAEDRRRIDAYHDEHRARWNKRHNAIAPISSAATRPARHDVIALATLRALRMPDSWNLDSIARRWYPGDSLLEAVRVRQQFGEVVLPDTSPGQSLIADLAAGHLAYVRDDYNAAAIRYAACVNHDRRSPYFWHCYAFALRHLGRHDEALYILTSTDALMTQRTRLSFGTDVRKTRQAKRWGLRLPEGEPAAAQPMTLDASDAVTRELAASRYQGFVEATRGGGQLPAFIAVVHELKPAMDIWVSQDGWAALMALVQMLELEYHVDACFDRHSPQLADVPSDQLTTTRAAFAPSLQDGAEAHVFLARNRPALDRVVGAGWYPLIVNGKVINKHLADHDKFGGALGYPDCCQDFFRRRNNWNHDNTYYAALLNTRGAPSALCNPFLRHTMYGLVPYMPCSYTCPSTMKLAGQLREIIRSELPAYAKAIEHASAKPLLCVSELRMYWFTGEASSRNSGAGTIDYSDVKSLYPVEASDPLYELLAAGNRCTVDGNIIHVQSAGAHLASYEARGDRHGPECPFILSFAAAP